jgi:protein involved in polysaccharide export with SLBB domain
MRCFIYILVVSIGMMLCGGDVSLATTIPSSGGRTLEAEPYIYTTGGVRKPGRYDWTKHLTLAEAIQMAGGFTESATTWIQVIHYNGKKENYKRDSTKRSPELEAGDRIFVVQQLQ